MAHGVISRPTQDLDLFTPAEGGPGQASAALLTALTDAGCQVQVLESAEQHGGEFMRLQVLPAPSVRRDRSRDLPNVSAGADLQVTATRRASSRS